MFNMFEELFSPGRKHTRDEANRLELTRVDVADGDPGRGPIDLESGRVVVRMPDPDPDPDRESASESAPDSEPESASDPESAPESEPELEVAPDPESDPELASDPGSAPGA